MAEKLTKVERLNKAKEEVAELLADILTERDAIKVGDFTFALESTEFPNQYVEITLTAKNPDPTAKSLAYDPIAKSEEYEAEKLLKAQAKAEKEAEKARKKTADEAKRASTKATKSVRTEKTASTEETTSTEKTERSGSEMVSAMIRAYETHLKTKTE